MAEARIEGAKPGHCLLQSQTVGRVLSDYICFFEGHLTPSSGLFERVAVAGMVDQDLRHRPGNDAEKVSPVRILCFWALGKEPKERLVY
jgi:hypothetical protein